MGGTSYPEELAADKWHQKAPSGHFYRQRRETLDLPYLTLLCDNLKNRMFLQNFFS
jgi:hypothetical protein